MSARVTGRVKWFNDVKGMGFVVAPDGTELFTHRTKFVPPLTMLVTDQTVSFEIVETGNGKGNGLAAVNVQAA